MKYLIALLLPVVTFAFDWNCNLYCFNGGECRHGKGPFGSFGNVDSENPWDTKSHVDGMYCSCSSGSTGLQCEISLKGCRTEDNGFQHTCDNGMDCKLAKNGEGHSFYHCECGEDTVFESPYVEKYCDHISTVFCSHNKNDDSFSSSQFCVNGGKCLPSDVNGTKHPGCECPDEWKGKHCNEKAGEDWMQQGKEMAINFASGKNLFLMVVIGVAVMGCCAFTANKLGIKAPRVRRRRKNKHEMAEERKFGGGLLRTSAKRKSKAPKKEKPSRKAGRRVGGKRVGGRPSTSAADEESEPFQQPPANEQQQYDQQYEQREHHAGLGSFRDGPNADEGEII